MAKPEGKSLPAIRAAEKILAIAAMLSEEQLDTAINAVSHAEATYGTLWGAGSPRMSGYDLDYYILKKRVVEFLKEIRREKIWDMAVAVALKTKEVPA